MDMCPQCGIELPLNKRVQPHKIDSALVFFHTDCFPEWFHKEIPILKVTHDGSSFVTQEPYTPEAGEEVTLECETMKQGKFYGLKEFNGF